MKQLAILLPNGATTLSSFILTKEVFETANEYYKRKGKAPKFHVHLVADNSNPTSKAEKTITIQHQQTIDEFHYADLIIVPSLGDDLDKALKGNEAIVEWITKAYKEGAEIASLCTGTFVLAAAGLLDGRQCSTHWSAAQELKNKFPRVNLAVEKIVTDEHGIYTTGGALSSMNLILHLVEKYYDRETAIYCAKIFEIDLDRNNQLAFIIFSGLKSHSDEEIKKAQLYIEKNASKKIMFRELSSSLLIDRRNFDRRFKKATGNSPLEYLQRVRIEAAKKLFETSRKNINEVMFEVGYSDLRTFRELFRRYTGISPISYRNKYNKERMGRELIIDN